MTDQERMAAQSLAVPTLEAKVVFKFVLNQCSECGAATAHSEWPVWIKPVPWPHPTTPSGEEVQAAFRKLFRQESAPNEALVALKHILKIREALPDKEFANTVERYLREIIPALEVA